MAQDNHADSTLPQGGNPQQQGSKSHSDKSNHEYQLSPDGKLIMQHNKCIKLMLIRVQYVLTS